MPERPAITEVYLQPGGCHFGEPHTRVRTRLGSDVPIVLRPPQARLGGMHPFILPTAGRPGAQCDGRYGDGITSLLAGRTLDRYGKAVGGTRHGKLIVDICSGRIALKQSLPPNASGLRAGQHWQ